MGVIIENPSNQIVHAFIINKITKQDKFYIFNDTVLVGTTEPISDEEIIIPSGVTTIYKSALNNIRSSGATIKVPSTVTEIYNDAFDQSFSTGNISVIEINKAPDSIPGAPWGATGATVNWTGSN